MTTELYKLPSSTTENIWTPNPVPPSAPSGSGGGGSGGGGLPPPGGITTNQFNQNTLPSWGSEPAGFPPPHRSYQGGGGGGDTDTTYTDENGETVRVRTYVDKTDNDDGTTTTTTTHVTTRGEQNPDGSYDGMNSVQIGQNSTTE